MDLSAVFRSCNNAGFSPIIWYFYCMQVCQKCGKEYEPKRRGGKFCSTSCRVVRYQLAKKGKQPASLHSGDEMYLARKLDAVGRSCTEVLAKVKMLPPEQAVVELLAVVQAWAGIGNNVIIERIIRDEEQERNQDYNGYHKRTGFY